MPESDEARWQGTEPLPSLTALLPHTFKLRVVAKLSEKVVGGRLVLSAASYRN